jgi:hypothetical protein
MLIANCKRRIIAIGVVLAISLVAASVALALGLLNLPLVPVTITHGVWNAGTMGSTLDIWLSNVPAGFDVTNGTYAGWCTEDNFQLNAPVTDLTLVEASGFPWDKINYLLNHRTGYSAQDVQVAIWLLTGTYAGTFPITAPAQALFDDANANGVGFVPVAGNVVAVWVVSDNFSVDQYQDTIIEVPFNPPPGGEGCTPGYWRNHYESWAATGYALTDDFDATFGVDYFNPNITLQDAIWKGGGGLNKIARHGTAALLSAAHPDVNYPYTVAEVIDFVKSGDVEALVSANELGCQIP